MFDRMFPVEVFDLQREFIRVFEPPRDFVFWSELMEEETKELRKAHEENEGMEQVFKEAADVIYVTAGFYNTMPIRTADLIPAELNEKVQARFINAVETLQEIIMNYMIPQQLLIEAHATVHASNMTKVGDDGLPIRSDGSDGNPKGKVLKGPNYQPPNMAPVVMKWDKHIQAMKDAGDIVGDTDAAGE